MKVHNVEQRSPEWYALRAGIPTASEFSRLITSDGSPSKQSQAYAMELAAEKFAGRPVDAFTGNAWTERGQELESAAIKLYRFARDVDVEKVGFVTDDAGTMGCSPDGLVGVDGMVEVKCLKADNHIKAILYFQKHGRAPTDHVQQTQGQLLICERAWCDLIFYHPELPFLVIRQHPIPDVFRAIRQEVQAIGLVRDQLLNALRLQEGAETASPAIKPPPLPIATDFNKTAPVF